MRNQLLGICTLALLLVAGRPGAASAHELKVDGTIAAVLHTDPDDNPTTGSPTEYILTFADSTDRFSLPKCVCRVAIIEQGRTIATMPLTITRSETSQGYYEFSRPDVYTMRFTGTPKQPGAFQPFVLSYEENIASDKASTKPLPAALWVGMSIGIGLILLVSYATNRAKQLPHRF